jgi:sterol-4alpha-carboxylate 3-dehydrogenase (decarboxylating)
MTTIAQLNTSDPKDAIPLTVLITGGLGCIGLAITSCFLKRHPDAHIYIIDLWIPDSQDSSGKFNAGVRQYHKVDITNSATVLDLFRSIKPQIGIHTAGLLPSAAKKLKKRVEGLTKVNVDGTKNVLDAAIDVGTEIFVLTSSCEVVRRACSQDLINVAEKDDDLDSNIEWDDKYSKSKVSRLLSDPASPLRSIV